jgi:predicted RNase H-like HicB family nuclease
MADHDEILAAARRICSERGTRTFTPRDIVRALPHLNAGTVRTHVTSRCCVNAPKNHPHKWDYFTRVARGRYEIRPTYRKREAGGCAHVREAAVQYGAEASATGRSTVHGVIARSGAWYAAECLELPVVTQGRTLDETVSNLREALALHLQGEDTDALGLATSLVLQVVFETPLSRVTPA